MTSDPSTMSGPDEFQSVNLSQRSVWIIDARAKRTDPHPQKIQVLHNSRPFGRSLKQSTETLRSSTGCTLTFSSLSNLSQPSNPPTIQQRYEVKWDPLGVQKWKRRQRPTNRTCDLPCCNPWYGSVVRISEALHQKQGLRSAPQKSRIVSGLFNTLQSAFGSCCIKWTTPRLWYTWFASKIVSMATARST